MRDSDPKYPLINGVYICCDDLDVRLANGEQLRPPPCSMVFNAAISAVELRRGIDADGPRRSLKDDVGPSPIDVVHVHDFDRLDAPPRATYRVHFEAVTHVPLEFVANNYAAVELLVLRGARVELVPTR